MYRLSTVRSADKIVAIRDGEAVESGTHEELMKAKGLYHSLVLAQISQVRNETSITIRLKAKTSANHFELVVFSPVI